MLVLNLLNQTIDIVKTRMVTNDRDAKSAACCDTSSRLFDRFASLIRCLFIRTPSCDVDNRSSVTQGISDATSGATGGTSDECNTC